LQGEHVKLWCSSVEVAASYGVKKGVIEDAIRSKTKLWHGYKWEYKDAVIEGEVWKQVSVKNNIVLHVSNKGRATRNMRKYPSYGSPSAEGYMRFCYGATKDNNRGRESVHRLVAIAFIPNPNNLPIVNHKNGNKADNSVENLEWCSHPYNTLHAYERSLIRKVGKPVARIDLETGERVVYESAVEAARQNNVKNSDSIGRVCRHQGKTCGGYGWEFA
jgi:HNH endonuclease